MEETKIIYYVDDEETPYLIRFQSSPDQITLGDFKNALNRPNYKYFFKSLDDDFGVVKEEIAEEEAHLPCVNGRVVSWLVAAEGSTQSDNQSSSGKEAMSGADVEVKDRSDSSDPKSLHYKQKSQAVRLSVRPEDNKLSHKLETPRTSHKFIGPEKMKLDDADDTFDEIDSIYNGDKVPPLRRFNDYKHGTKLKKIRSTSSQNSTATANSATNGTSNVTTKQQQPVYESSSSMLSSDLDTTSFFDSEDESSRFSSCTETTMSSKYGRQKRQMRRRRKMPHLSHASSFSSMTDSTVSLNIITVTLNMDTVPFLGISIVGQTNGSGENGDGGIYVGSIMKGGAVALDGRIEPGDMILEVNGISFENVSNEEAVRTLREQVQKPGSVTLVVAKSWDPNPAGYMMPQQDPVQPIDPRAWVLHTQALGTVDQFNQPGNYLPYTGGMSTVASTVTTNSSSVKSSSVVQILNQQNKNFMDRVEDNLPNPLLSNHDPSVIVRAMSLPDSGLLVRDRLWLKITIYNAFIGSDLVDWLFSRVQGFVDRKEARKYATNLLKSGHIKHTVNKNTFSEQCYYVFNELHAAMSCLNLESEIDSVSVVAGQHQTKSRLMHQGYCNKESPVLSSGFQSACSNKWSGFSGQPDVKQDVMQDVMTPAAYQAIMYPVTSNNYKHAAFYNDSTQHPGVNVAPVSNQKTSRPPGSAHSGSGVNNCVCLHSLGVMKAVRHFWEGTGKQAVMMATKTATTDFERERNGQCSARQANGRVHSAANMACVEDSGRDLSSSNWNLSVAVDSCERHASYRSVKHDQGSSASGSGSNVTRSMAVYQLQNAQPAAGSVVVVDCGQPCVYNSPPPPYQQSVIQSIPAMSSKSQSVMSGDLVSNQMSLIMHNENSSSGFFSDGVDKCD